MYGPKQIVSCPFAAPTIMLVLLATRRNAADPTAPPCANAKGLEEVPWLDSAKWIAQCGNTAVGQTCSKTNTICAGGFVGTVSAVCFAAGWQVIQGQDRCGGRRVDCSNRAVLNLMHHHVCIAS